MISLAPDCEAQVIDPVSIFVNAVSNEMHRDSYIFERFSVSRYTNLVIPRLEKLTYVARVFPRLLACVARVSSVLWPLLLYPVFLLLQLASMLRHIRWRKIELVGDIFFVTSKTSLLFSKSSGFKGMHVYASKKLERSCTSENSIGSISDYIILSDIARAFLYSVRALLLLSRTNQVPGAAFQAYAAFGWFLTWSVLYRNADRLTSVWVSNDCDRWAVLFDQLPTKAKKIIVQHGLLCDPPNHAGFRNPASLPTRLKHIGKVILFDKESEQKYRDMVIANDCNPSFTCCDTWLIQGSPETDDQAEARVMLIGQRGYLEQECELANYLAATLAHLRIYVRPHPGLPSTQYRNRLDSCVVLIDDLYLYPFAEICICFDTSSLGDLYEKQGAQIIYLTGSKLDLETKEDVRDRVLQIVRTIHDKTTAVK